MQLRLVALLNAELADVLGAPVIGLVFRVLDLRFFGLVDAPDIANRMAGHFAQRVAAKQPRLDIDAGKAVALGAETRHFFVGQAGANRQRVKVARLFLEALKAAPIALVDIDHLGQRVYGVTQVCDLGGRDL